LTTAQVVAIETTDIVGLNVSQLAALGDKYNGSTPFTTSQIAALRSSGLTIQQVTPLVIDLDGNGVSTTSLANGTMFDLDRDGQRDKTGWVSSGDGLLVRDLNEDGEINDGAELFGSFTTLSGEVLARDGYEALSSLDENSDGYVDAADAGFSGLMVWRDSNADGLTDKNELLSLQAAGVSRLGTLPTVDVRVDSGNTIGLRSDVIRADGSVSEMADVWFQSVLSD
jgi:hypothetical protein